eukprot:TRINITY_DN60080_c0_g1_i1.p1 TRINITY_DN60080_c0_g1~~TRINITY_DN60080_c0_g1_i1.p1  ORF type:complete len:382 (+),score=63.05 TRINITY_DN60080_c0_g1_i1:46-1191(+)
MSLKRRADEFCQRTGRKRCAQLPEEALDWDDREADLWFYTDGDFHPREMLSDGWAPTPAAGAQKGRISVICVTTSDRDRFHELLLWNFQCQHFDDKELVVVETYVDEPSSFLAGKAAWMSNMKLISLPRPPGEDLSIGTKRNLACHVASGELIAHFDDDDIYAPSYLITMVSRFDELHDPKVIKLQSWHVGNAELGTFGYADPARHGRRCHKSRNSPDIQIGLYGFGFSLVYLRAVALEMPFPDEDVGEDYDWCLKLLKIHGKRAVILIPEDDGLVLHVEHGENVTDCKPFIFRDIPMSEVKNLHVSKSPGFGAFLKHVEVTTLANRKAESEVKPDKSEGLPPHLAGAIAASEMRNKPQEQMVSEPTFEYQKVDREDDTIM